MEKSEIKFIRNKRTGILESWKDGKKEGPILTMESAMANAGEEGCVYEVVALDEDAADLKYISKESDEIKMVSRYYLPPEIKVGTRLKYENLGYVIVK